MPPEEEREKLRQMANLSMVSDLEEWVIKYDTLYPAFAHHLLKIAYHFDRGALLKFIN